MRCKACDRIMRVITISDEYGERLADVCGVCSNAVAVSTNILARDYTFSECEDEISQLFYEKRKKVLDI